MISAFRLFCAPAAACGFAGILAAANLSPVSTVQVTDLFRPHNDPDDHRDLEHSAAAMTAALRSLLTKLP